MVNHHKMMIKMFHTTHYILQILNTQKNKVYAYLYDVHTTHCEQRLISRTSIRRKEKKLSMIYSKSNTNGSI